MFSYSWETSKNVSLYLLTRDHFSTYNFLSNCTPTFSYSLKHIYVSLPTCIIKVMIKKVLFILSKKQKNIITRVPLYIKFIFSSSKQITIPSNLLPMDTVHLTAYFLSNSEKKPTTYTSILTIFMSIFITCPSTPIFYSYLTWQNEGVLHLRKKTLSKSETRLSSSSII